MILFIVMPLWAMLTKSVQNAQGEFVGLANFATIFRQPVYGTPLVTRSPWGYW